MKLVVLITTLFFSFVLSKQQNYKVSNVLWKTTTNFETNGYIFKETVDSLAEDWELVKTYTKKYKADVDFNPVSTEKCKELDDLPTLVKYSLDKNITLETFKIKKNDTMACWDFVGKKRVTLESVMRVYRKLVVMSSSLDQYGEIKDPISYLDTKGLDVNVLGVDVYYVFELESGSQRIKCTLPKSKFEGDVKVGMDINMDIMDCLEGYSLHELHKNPYGVRTELF